MNRVALMQPYLFPYIGYFQLISAVDLFVVYDDVQWMKGGWINRNRVLTPAGTAEYLGLPVKGDSLTKNINERFFSDGVVAEKQKILGKLAVTYKGAPHVETTVALVEKIFGNDETNVARFVTNSIEQICRHLNIPTEIVVSSGLDKSADLRSRERVIDIAKLVNAAEYINAIGGQGLYDKDLFREHGIKLSFLRSRGVVYQQFDAPFLPDLSIIDVLMFNSTTEVEQLLTQFELV
jgi:hypothetical protein